MNKRLVELLKKNHDKKNSNKKQNTYNLNRIIPRQSINRSSRSLSPPTPPPNGSPQSEWLAYQIKLNNYI